MLRRYNDKYETVLSNFSSNFHLVIVVFFQTVPLRSIIHELDKSFILSKCTVWRSTGRTLYKREMSNVPMCYIPR